MARYTGPKDKLSRRFVENLTGSPTCAVVRKPYPPGIHGKDRRKTVSEYGKQLAMKQKIRGIYGVLERQFRKYFEEARRSGGVTGDRLVSLLESRLDNAVYRLGFALTRPQARQLVSHRLFVVNGRRVSVPSYRLAIGDKIALYPPKKNSAWFKNQEVFVSNKRDVPSWLKFDAKALEATVVSLPGKTDGETGIDPQLVVEFYSK